MNRHNFNIPTIRGDTIGNDQYIKWLQDHQNEKTSRFLYRQAGNEVQVTWKAEEYDDIVQELGEDFKNRFQALSFSVMQNS